MESSTVFWFAILAIKFIKTTPKSDVEVKLDGMWHFHVKKTKVCVAYFRSSG
jgi:hypothetical protein